jgi:hypothetical protein
LNSSFCGWCVPIIAAFSDVPLQTLFMDLGNTPVRRL